jgi:signal transduction histidine kinase
LAWTNKGKAGKGLLTHLHLEAGRTADFLFADLDRAAAGNVPDAPNPRRAALLLILASAGIVAACIYLAVDRVPSTLITLWGAPALAGLSTAAILALRPSTNLASPRAQELLAVMLGLIWASIPALFFDVAGPELRIFGAAFIFALAGIGSLAFSRIPSAAILHCGLIAGAASLTALKLGGTIGPTAMVLSIFYGLAVAGIVLSDHRRNLRLLQANREQRRQKDIIALLLNDFEQGTADWLWEAGPDFRLTYASPRLAQLLGIAEADLAGLPLTSLGRSGPEAARGWPDFLKELAAHEPVLGRDLDLVAAARRVHCRVTARPLFAADGAFLGYRGVGRDVTTEQQALAELLRAKNDAEQANAAKSHFLAVMSHELKTPLNAIVGFTELLASPQADFLGEEARADHLRTILESSRHLQSLINDILDATRIEKGTMVLAEQEADAAELVEVAVKMCRDLAERADATIVARIIEGVEVRGDITRLKQILINLITNAVKFSTSGGFVYVGFERHGDGLAFTIRDSGVGIKPADIERVFQPFVQAEEGTARRFGGVGLGLSIARKLARLHGGDVTLDSDIGAGTTARLMLPAARVTWAAAPHPSAAVA